MFNYRITRINACSVFKYVTIISLIAGGICGLGLGLLSHDMIGIPGGLFLGFIFGLVNGIVASIYTFLFNLLSSSIGGIEIHLARKDAFLENLEQPIPLVNTSELSGIKPPRQETDLKNQKHE